MVQFTMADIVGLLINLTGITLSWIFIVKNYRSFRKLNPKNSESKRSFTNDFAIGLGAGLMVFVLGRFADSMSFSGVKLDSISGFLYSFFTGFISLCFQFSILFAILSWIAVFTFKDLDYKRNA